MSIAKLAVVVCVDIPEDGCVLDRLVVSVNQKDKTESN